MLCLKVLHVAVNDIYNSCYFLAFNDLVVVLVVVITDAVVVMMYGLIVVTVITVSIFVVVVVVVGRDDVFQKCKTLL